MMTDLNLVTPYVSNLDQDVFALRNLPEEVAAVLFAYYSRSPNDLRSNLAKLLADQDLAVVPGVGDGGGAGPDLRLAREKAKAFNEKWVVGYGHGSVAEHAVVRLAVERCSIVAAKAIEESRLMAVTEKSTRYIEFDESSFYRDANLPSSLQGVYFASAQQSLRAYKQLLPLCVAALRKHAPHATEKQCQTKAFDLLRGLLPAGTLTNLGVTLNGRLAEHRFSQMQAHPLTEVRRLGVRMAEEAGVQIPTLLKYVAPRNERKAALAAVRDLDADRWPETARDEMLRSVRKLEAPQQPLWKLATMILLEARPELEYAEARFRTSLEKDARPLIDAYLSRRGARENVGRPFEHLTWAFEIRCDYGAWRDLQRHRMVSQTTPLLSCDEGYDVDPLLAELGLYAQVAEALKAARGPWEKLAAHDPWEAQYAVPLAYRVRYVLRANLRELFHLIELRSSKQGHPSYRRIAQQLADEVLDDCPFLKDYLRVDRAHYDFARPA